MGLIGFQLFKYLPSTEANSEPNSIEQSQQQDIEQQKLDCQFTVLITQSLQMKDRLILAEFIPLPSPYSQRVAIGNTACNGTWEGALKIYGLFSKVLDFLNIQQWQIMKQSCKTLKKSVIVKILQNDNNWNLTMTILAPYIIQETHLKQSGIDDDYEHSEDLDRTSGYFQNQNTEDVLDHQAKLDRIITTLSFKIKYFQGIMPICATLLQCFNQNISYWLLRYLLFKSEFIQLDMQLYHRYLMQLDQQFSYLLPRVYSHLQNRGFELNDFVMKWIMGLFSQDMSKTMILAFWDLLCQTDVYLMIYFIIEIFSSFQEEILNSDADQINEMLKNNLKDKLSQLNCQKLMNETKLMYIRRRLNIQEIRCAQ